MLNAPCAHSGSGPARWVSVQVPTTPRPLRLRDPAGPAQRRGRAAPARVALPVRSSRALPSPAGLLAGRPPVGAPGRDGTPQDSQDGRGAHDGWLRLCALLLPDHRPTLAVIRRDSGHYPVMGSRRRWSQDDGCPFPSKVSQVSHLPESSVLSPIYLSHDR